MAGLNKKSKGINIFAGNKTINGGRTPLMTTGMGRKGQPSGTTGKGKSYLAGRVPIDPVRMAGQYRTAMNTQVGVRGKRK